MSKLLFPISLGNNLFSTKNVISALNSISVPYEQIIFVIADQLQLYNRAIQLEDENGLLDTIKKFYSGEPILAQRRAWLKKIENTENTFRFSAPWQVFGLDDFADRIYSLIYRNVMILFNTNNKFRDDVIKEAKGFVERRKDASENIENNINLSSLYILEEIAFSIRIHLGESIYDEFYLGNPLNCIVNLYKGEYGINVFSLANMEEQSINWRFYYKSFDLFCATLDSKN